MKTSEVAEMIASFLDGQEIVEPVEGELVASTLKGKNEVILSIWSSPSKEIMYRIRVERI